MRNARKGIHRFLKDAGLERVSVQMRGERYHLIIHSTRERKSVLDIIRKVAAEFKFDNFSFYIYKLN